jgi:predicted SAM-dependent methyltransferase
MRSIELGSGYHPDMSYDLHMDINPACPHLEHVGSIDKVPYPDNTFDKVRAVDVLEHFSYRDTVRVLKEWYRILVPEGKLLIQCPNAKLLAKRWLEDDLPIIGRMPIDYSASYWIMGGHGDGVFAYAERDDWRWNAHYTLLSPESLGFYLKEAGFKSWYIQSDGGSNMVCLATK